MVMAITLTQSAADQIRSYLDKDQSRLGLRFGVRTSGCSGFAYIVELADSIQANEKVFEIDGIKIIINTESLPLIEGTQIDYARGNLSDSFVFNNPNVTASCGCGESFTTNH